MALVSLWCVGPACDCGTGTAFDDDADVHDVPGEDDATGGDGDRDGDGTGDAEDDGAVPEVGLVPEGPATHFDLDGGPDDHVEWAITTPAAFSGSVYELVVRVHGPGMPVPTGRIGVCRLAPGGDLLGTTWTDATDEGAVGPSICWSGEAFVVALPAFTPVSATEDVLSGVRLLSFDEAGTRLHGPEMIPFPYALTPADPYPEPLVLCPNGGPILVGLGWGASGTDRLHLLSGDGAPSGDPIDLDLPEPDRAAWTRGRACTTWGAELACLSDGVLHFVARDGTLRASEAVISSPEIHRAVSAWALAVTTAGIAILWPQAGADPDKVMLMYARVTGDGHVVVPPAATGQQVASRIPWLAAAGSIAGRGRRPPSSTRNNGCSIFSSFSRSGRRRSTCGRQ